MVIPARARTDTPGTGAGHRVLVAVRLRSSPGRARREHLTVSCRERAVGHPGTSPATIRRRTPENPAVLDPYMLSG